MRFIEVTVVFVFSVPDDTSYKLDLDELYLDTNLTEQQAKLVVMSEDGDVIQQPAKLEAYTTEEVKYFNEEEIPSV